jgi:hypothetical protein
MCGAPESNIMAYSFVQSPMAWEMGASAFDSRNTDEYMNILVLSPKFEPCHTVLCQSLTLSSEMDDSLSRFLFDNFLQDACDIMDVSRDCHLPD